MKHTVWVGGLFGMAVLIASISAQASDDDFTVNKSGPDTVHVPYQPGEDSQNSSSTPTHTIMAPTWPVQVPVNVPENVQEPPENLHAGENETPEANPETR